MKFTTILLLFVLFSVSGCRKVDKLTQFTMEYDQTIVIPSTIGINLPFNIPTPDIETHSGKTFELNSTQKSLIEEIRLKHMDLSLVSPRYADFSFLESIVICITAEDLPELEIAWAYDIDEDVADFLELETADTDVQKYIKADHFMLLVKNVTDELVTSEHQIELHCVFFVDARILGQ